MADPEKLNADRYVVVHLRRRADMPQTEFAEKSGVNQSDVSKYERGDVAVPEAALRRMAEVADMEWPLVVHLRRFLAALLSAEVRRRDLRGAELPDLAVLQPALLAAAPYLIEARGAAPKEQRPEEARREAEEIWTALERYPIPRRRRLIELSLRAAKSAALAMRICEASTQAADRNAEEALELAELAFSIAERVQGEESGRVQGYCRERLLHARRAADEADLAGA